MRHRRKSGNRFIRLVIFVVCIVGIVYFFYSIHKSPATKSPPPVSPLAKVVTQAMHGSDGRYGIVIKNLKTGEKYAYNDQIVFDSASLYKLWVMATAFEQIQQGKLDPNKTLSEDVSTLNNEMGVDQDDALLTDGTITIDVTDALKNMVTISDNYDAQLLTNTVGLSNIAAFLNTQGFMQSSVGDDGDLPTTTAADIALFFKKLYSGQLANKMYTAQMISLLKGQQVNTKIPADLPSNIVVAHKTGELEDYSHDAGIVYTSKGAYIIVVLSKSDDPTSADERIAAVSKAVYTYVTKD